MYIISIHLEGDAYNYTGVGGRLMIGFMFLYTGRWVYNWVGLINGGGGGGFYAAVYRSYI